MAVDVVVVGAGFAGLTAARRLAEGWAGTETAEVWMGYIDGAIRSGERVADEVAAVLAGGAR